MKAGGIPIISSRIKKKQVQENIKIPDLPFGSDKPADEIMHNFQFQPVKHVGIDMMLKTIITASDGSYIEPPYFLRKSGKNLSKTQ